MAPMIRESKAVYLHGCNIRPGDKEHFSGFEEKRNILACGAAYPTSDSWGSIACGRALDTAVDCFIERPSISDMAFRAISGFINDDIFSMQEGDKAFLCNMAMLYIFKGKARLSLFGDSAVLFYENGILKGSWYGSETPVGKKAEYDAVFSEEFELSEDSRFIFVAGEDKEATESASEYFRENNGEVPDDEEAFFMERHCSYVSLLLPKRERRGFLR